MLSRAIRLISQRAKSDLGCRADPLPLQMEMSELMVEYLFKIPPIPREIVLNILQTAKLPYDDGSMQLLCERLSILWDDYNALSIEQYKRRWLIKSQERCSKISAAATELLRLVPGNRSGPFATELLFAWS